MMYVFVMKSHLLAIANRGAAGVWELLARGVYQLQLTPSGSVAVAAIQ